MTLLLYDDIFLKHDTGPYHPENYRRLECTIDYLKSTGLWDKCELTRPRAATVEEVALVHDMDYINRARLLAESGGGQLDPDTTLSRDSYQAALYAAGALLTASDAVMDKKNTTNAFCMVRPPGHHAGPARGMGFCVFNNVAIAAQYLITRHKLKRVLIVDWDCHHGNGTQEIFYGEPRVLYVSLHRWPFYPGTGADDEKGDGRGEGLTVNIPVKAGTPAEEYIRLFSKVMDEDVSSFKPEFILISAGFDTYTGDPVGGLGLTADDFAALTGITVDTASRCCGGRIVSCLEGGYNLQGLPLCIGRHLDTLLGAS